MVHLTKTFKRILLITCIFFSASLNSSALDDAIIAVVNDETITLKDLQNYIHSIYVSLVAEGVKEDELKEAMTQLQKEGIYRLIEDKLILSKANQVGLEVHSKRIDERFQEIKKRYPSEKNFMDTLIQNGLTITDLRNKINDQLKIKYMVEREVKDKIYVNPQEITEYYEKNKEQFKRAERVQLDSIFIGYQKDKQEAIKKAREALDRLKKEENFTSVAREYSQAPSIGMIERGHILPEVEEVVFKLEKGEISSLVEVENGIYIFKLIEKLPAELSELKDVKDSIYQILFDQKFKEQYMAWLEKLKKDAYVEIK